MNYDEFAFFNQQLAAMLRDGIPLEGALRQLCAQMQHGPLRVEIESLEADLAKGVPLADAVKSRKLPELYAQMLRVGVQSNDLPGVLVTLADYYHRASSIWARLRGLMIYPLIVLVVSLALSVLMAFIYNGLVKEFPKDELDWLIQNRGQQMMMQSWFLPSLFALATAFVLIALALPNVRRALRWRLPAFREASLSQFASSAALLLRNGGNLNNALGLLRQLESGTPAGAELGRWQSRLGEGHARFADMTANAKVFPPLFLWLVQESGEDMEGGFKQAAEIYHARAVHRIEMLLYAALPVSVVLLGVMIVGQFFPVLRVLTTLLGSLGDVGNSPGSQ
ncbi:MAG: type II secretion system F family protein [Verrucomicrobia bacterium]|nr:type II secretion system F family protein [Verrucomicrobiota bacterium]